MTGRQRGVAATVLLCAAALAVFAWWWTRGPDVGDRLIGGHVSGDSGDVQVELPHGEADVRVRTGGSAYQYGDEVTAHGDNRFVEVVWSPKPGFEQPVWKSATPAQRKEPTTSLAIRTGGRTYEVRPGLVSSDDDGSVTVLVEGDASDLEVLATSGTRVQTLRPTQDEDQTRHGYPAFTGCTAVIPQDHGLRWRPLCRMSIQRTAYVTGLGWAPQGQEWLVATGVVAGPDGSDVEWQAAGGGSAHYVSASDARVTLSVSGGAQPRHRHGTAPVDGATRGVEDRAYLVPQGRPVTTTLTYTGSARLDPDDADVAGAPATVSLRTRYEAVR